MSNKYAGETDQKKCARALLYTCVGYHAGQDPRPLGDWVTLAGPEAREFAILEALRLPHERLIMVDTDRSGTDAANSLGACGYNGTLADCLYEMRRDQRQIAFVHFDFMGTTNADVKRTMKRAAPIMRNGSIAAWTFLRGREFERNQMWRDALRRVRETPLGPEVSSAVNGARRNRDGERFFGYAQQMGEWLDGGVTIDAGERFDRERNYWLPLANIAYDSGNSPMGILVMKKMPHPMLGARKLSAAEEAAFISRIAAPPFIDVSKDYSGSVRALALQMSSSSDKQANIEARDFIRCTMGVDSHQLAAWKAVETMRNRRHRG